MQELVRGLTAQSEPNLLVPVYWELQMALVVSHLLACVHKASKLRLFELVRGFHKHLQLLFLEIDGLVPVTSATWSTLSNFLFFPRRLTIWDT